MKEENDVLTKRANIFKQHVKKVRSKTSVPPFYRYKTLNNELLEDAIQNLMKEKIVNFYTERFPTPKECRSILSELRNGKKLISYNKNVFKQIKAKYSPRFDILFNEANISQFRIARKYFDIDEFIEFCLYLIKIGKEFIHLLQCSSSGDGLLTEADFEKYLKDAFTRMRYFKQHLDIDLSSEERPFYFCYIKEKLYNQLDYFARNRLSATSLVSSVNFTLFLELDNISDNCLSIEKFEPIYNSFANNVKENGLLSQEGISKCYNNRLNPAYISRFFELANCYGNSLDFCGYTQFRNIHYHIKEKLEDNNVIRFLFRIFDVSSTGTIDPQDILFFYNGSLRSTKVNNLEFDTFLQEILDRVGCHTESISLELFLNCGVAYDISTIFIDLNAFSQLASQED